MNIKQLKEKLNQFPDDMEVLIGNFDWFEFENEFNVSKIELNHCNYTNKWSSNVDYYSKDEEYCGYRDVIDGKILDVKIPMERKEFVILEI